MATQFAPMETWANLPTTIDEQADILRQALRIGGSPRRELGDGVWLERWEADLLVREGRKVGPAAREAIVLLQARAAEWATHKQLLSSAVAPDSCASLIEWALATFGEVRDSLDSEPRGEVSALEARLLDLKTRVAPRGFGLAPVVAWRAPATRLPERPVVTSPSGVVASDSATSVMDRADLFAQIAKLEAAEGGATMVLDRAALLDAVDFAEFTHAETNSGQSADGGATMVLDRAAILDAVDFAEFTHGEGNSGQSADGGATMVLDRAAIAAATTEFTMFASAAVPGVVSHAATIAIDRGSFLDELAAYDARAAATSPGAGGRDDGSTIVLDRAAILAELDYDLGESPASSPSGAVGAVECFADEQSMPDFDLADLSGAVEVVESAAAPVVTESAPEPAVDLDLDQDSAFLLAAAVEPVAPGLAPAPVAATPAGVTLVAPESDSLPIVADRLASAGLGREESAELAAVVQLPPAAAPASAVDAAVDTSVDTSTGSRRLLYAAAAAGIIVASGVAAVVLL